MKWQSIVSRSSYRLVVQIKRDYICEIALKILNDFIFLLGNLLGISL